MRRLAAIEAARSDLDTTATDLLRELVAEIRGLRADLTQQRSTSTLSREDHAVLVRLLPAVAGAIGSELFSSAELCAHTASAVRLVCAGLTVRQLGRLLRRAVDTPVAGYMVRRQGSEANAVLWQIFQVPEFPGNENVFVPHAVPRNRV